MNGDGLAVIDAEVVLDRQHYAAQITAAWQASVEAIVQTGHELLKAKEDLPHGEFGLMFERDEVPFSWRTGQRLMEVSSHPALSNATYMSHLPAAWGTLYQLSRAAPAVVESWVHSGDVHPELSQAEANALVRSLKTRGLPPQPLPGKVPLLLCESADSLSVADESIDLIITSPPYNLGAERWPMGGNTVERKSGIGYADSLSEDKYQAWQLKVLIELYRVAKAGGSLFYNHKLRQTGGTFIHPLDWLRADSNPWVLRQEVVWDRLSTHNHAPSLFWPEDERIFWMTKGKPTLPDRPINQSTVWDFSGPTHGEDHPAPFPEELPLRCLKALGREGISVLDPFGGSMTTCKVAADFGYDAIGVDISQDYIDQARTRFGWH